MNSKSLLYLFNIALLCTTVFGDALTKDEVLSLNGYNSQYYCKDDICVETNNYIEVGTIIIPNNEGKNITYITETCSMTDIDLDHCRSKNCTVDSECLSNKCVKGHCSFNKANPIVHCRYIPTDTVDALLGDYKTMQCGLPDGDTCENNNDCSSKYCNYSKICGEREESSSGGSEIAGALVIYYVLIPVIFIGIIACVCCFLVQGGKDLDQKRKNKKDLSVV